jgi:hypothetical protein
MKDGIGRLWGLKPPPPEESGEWEEEVFLSAASGRFLVTAARLRRAAYARNDVFWDAAMSYSVGRPGFACYALCVRRAHARLGMTAMLNQGVRICELFRADREDLLALDFDFYAERRANVAALHDGAANPNVPG